MSAPVVASSRRWVIGGGVEALADVLIRANWAKRVLFLADRTALVNQAVGAFKAHLPDSSPVNLVTERTGEGRVYVSTYPTMMNLINAPADGKRRFGPGHFDLVVVDEAHRSVFKKYRTIFEHFDSLLVGLTATPRDEIDRSTYSLFDLEAGVPTDAYPLSEAVADGFLVLPRAVAVPTRFTREGIRYDVLLPEEQEEWDDLEWDDDGGDPPDRVGAEALNKWLFNADTVDKVLHTLMTKGVRVAGGDRIGKTIVFAKNQAHAEFIAARFDVNDPQHAGTWARVITHRTEFAQSLIDDFYVADSPPRIAISVDMLDTGIDVPEVVNLVFVKPVRSKIKFWQMLGRGTRLCPDLFGPGKDKDHFQVFDHCQSFEFFNQRPDGTEGAVTPSVRQRRFVARLDLLGALQAQGDPDKIRPEVADLVWREVDGMIVANIEVRPHRRLVERFSEPEAWVELSGRELAALAADVAGLPTTRAPEDPDLEDSKRFDLLVLKLQLALLRGDPGFVGLRDQAVAVASVLEEQAGIPAVQAQLPLIAAVQTEEWWEGITLPMLQTLRSRLRNLVPLIEKRKRAIVYTDFEDEEGEHVAVAFRDLVSARELERFRRKATAFLREHRGEIAIKKLHHNWPITTEDMAELQRVLVDAGVGTADDCAQARAEAGSFGVFVRSLVGLDRAAAQEAFGEFLEGGTWTGAQIEFVNLIIDALSQHGVVEPRRFYESPFTDLSPQGPEALFAEHQIDQMVSVLEDVRERAAVA